MKGQFFGFVVAMVVGSFFVSADFYISNFMTTGEATPNNFFSEIQSSLIQNTCDGCKWIVRLFRYYLKIGLSAEKIIEVASSICVKSKMQTESVCNPGIELLFTELIKISKNVSMSTAEICYFIMDEYCVGTELPLWNVLFPRNPKPKVLEIPLPKKDAPKLKVLHLSDVHYDPLYVEGTNAFCTEPLCCREHNGFANASANAAGKWGHFKCDLPKRTLEHVLDHIYKTHKDIDYVIWTGDIAPHDVWMQNNEQLMRLIEENVEVMSEKLPGFKVFPAIGNHERAPVNSFPTVEQDGSISIFYNDIETLWSRWLPPNVSSTMHRGAFYSVSVKPGLRIISLNTNVCANLNFWLLQNSNDPYKELAWLIDELQKAENANEKVHIIGHIAPGSEDCVRVWSQNYYEIIGRYEHTVMAQFFGHEHSDQFKVFYDPKNLSRANNIAYIGPSITPYGELNPGYRIYYIDGDHDKTTRMVVDHETWIMDLEAANINDNPTWFKSYSAKNEYSLKGLRPVDWSGLIENMKNDDKLFDSYFKNYWKHSPVRPQCESECKREMLCQARTARSHDKLHFCMDLETTTDGSDEAVEVPHPDSTNAIASKSPHKFNVLHRIIVSILVYGIATLAIFLV